MKEGRAGMLAAGWKNQGRYGSEKDHTAWANREDGELRSRERSRAGLPRAGLALWDAVKLGCCELCHQLKAPQYRGWVAGSPLSQLPSSWSMYVTGLG